MLVVVECNCDGAHFADTPSLMMTLVPQYIGIADSDQFPLCGGGRNRAGLLHDFSPGPASDNAKTRMHRVKIAAS